MFDMVVDRITSQACVQAGSVCNQLRILSHSFESYDVISSYVLVTNKRHRDNLFGKLCDVSAIVLMLGNLDLVLLFVSRPHFRHLDLLRFGLRLDKKLTGPKSPKCESHLLDFFADCIGRDAKVVSEFSEAL